MIVLLGASGYIGQAFERTLREWNEDYAPLSRKTMDYTRYDILVGFLREQQPDFLINAAGYVGRPNVDACETARADTLAGCLLLPVMISHACRATGTPWGHVSSGCIYNGAKIFEGGVTRVEKDLTAPAVQTLIRNTPEAVCGFSELDEPNFSFRKPPCSFYSGVKALAEEALADDDQVYIWRLRIPFDHRDNPRNVLTKLQTYSKVYDNVNSLSQLGDFVQACLELWRRRTPFGIYNITNPGYVTSRQVVGIIERILKPNRVFQYWADDTVFYRVAAKTPRSNCVLDVTKLLATGIRMKPVEEALTDALRDWRIEPELARSELPQ